MQNVLGGVQCAGELGDQCAGGVRFINGWGDELGASMCWGGVRCIMC